MSKINFLPLILVIALLSSCGFHTPENNTPLNASVISTKHNAFTTELEKHFNPTAAKFLTIQIGNELQEQKTASFDTAGQIRRYTLSISVPVKVFKEGKLLFSEDLIQRVNLERVIETQADRLQITEHYNELRATLVKRLLRKLKYL